MSAPGTISGSGITFSGLASGVNTQAIISALMQAQSAPLQQYQAQQQNIQNQQAVYNQLSSDLTAIQSAAGSLNSYGAFNAVAPSSSSPTVATATAASGALPGTYNLTVTQLAQAQKIASAAQNSATAALNLAGTFVIDGKAVTVANTDTLTSIAQKINSAGTGATASVIDGGTGNTYLTLTASQTGVANQVQLADISGSVLGSLGVVAGSASIRQAITNGAQSYSFSSESTPIGTLSGLTGSGTFSINGTSVGVNFATDSLSTIASNINAAGISGVTASVVPSATGSPTTYSLQITGSTTPTFGDPTNLLSGIGILQAGAGNQIVAAQDANFKIDNVSLTNSSNTVTNVIPNVTLSLLQGTSANPGTTTISLSTDTTGITTNVQSLMSAYNSMVDFIAQNSTMNPTTYQTGPLFGDPIANQVQQSMNSVLLNNVPGLTGTYTNLSQIGFSMDQSGHLQLNSTAFDQALQSNPTAVAALFQAVGTSTNSDLSFVATGTATKASSTAGYSVDITQAATEQTVTAGTAQTAASTATETLTFGGSLLSGNSYNLNIPVATTQSQLVTLINSDSTLSPLMTASVNGSGDLVLTSNRYGTPGGFTVTSSVSAASNNSGIGTGSTSTVVSGLDVAGTINGEAATGNGQFLTGNTGNTNTAGLQIEYSGASTGNVGSMVVSLGATAQINQLTTSYTAPGTGLFTSENNSLNQELSDIQTQITNLNAYLQQYQQQLTQEFAYMEQTIAQLQSQGAGLSSIASASTAASNAAAAGASSNNTSGSSGSSGGTPPGG